MKRSRPPMPVSTWPSPGRLSPPLIAANSAARLKSCRDEGRGLLFLSRYSPDLNPIEMVFSKLKAPLRKRAALSFDMITQTFDDIISSFSVSDCRNLFKAAGYEAK